MSLQGISGRVVEIATMVVQIAEAAEWQNGVVQEVNQSVGDISEVAGRTAEGAQRTDAANENRPG